jgi:uncharacterized protein (TIGR00251 family)
VVAGGVEIDVLVSPKSGKSEVEGFDEWRNRLVVKLKAPPEKGEANRELVFLLGAALGARIELVRGHTSRTKTVLAMGNAATIEKKLEALIARP